MKATFKLRWHESYKEGQKEHACGVNVHFYPEVGQTAFVLQQWWEDKKGNGEWRDIPTDYSFNMKTKE